MDTTEVKNLSANEQVKQLPKAMADPIAIFESSGNAKTQTETT